MNCEQKNDKFIYIVIRARSQTTNNTALVLWCDRIGGFSISTKNKSDKL